MQRDLQMLQMSRSIKVPYFFRNSVSNAIYHFFSSISRTLIVAPSGARHLTHGRVAALEKGETIARELRLAMSKMTNSHSQPLKVALH